MISRISTGDGGKGEPEAIISNDDSWVLQLPIAGPSCCASGFSSSKKVRNLL